MRALLAPIAALALCACDMTRPTRPIAQPPACPEKFSEQMRFDTDVSCSPKRCRMTQSQQDCLVQFDFSDCNLSATSMAVQAQLDAEGRPTFLSSPGLGDCEARDVHDDAVLSFRCSFSGQSCDFDLYEPEQRPLRAVSMRLLPQACPAQPGETIDRLDGQSTQEGCLSGLTEWNNHIIVARHDEYRPFECADIASELLWVDLGLLIITETSSAPPCLSHLVTGPGDRLYGLAQGPSLVELGPEGIINSAPIDHPQTEQPLYPAALVYDAQRGALLVGVSDRRASSPGYVLSFDAELTQRAISEPLVGTFRSAALIDPDALALPLRISGQVVVLDPASLQEIGRTQLQSPRRVSNNPGALIGHRAGQLLTASSGQSPAVWIIGGGPSYELPEFSTALFYESLHYPSTLQKAPWSSDQVIVGLTGDGNTKSKAAILDVSGARFIPGSTGLGGTGAVGPMLTDSRGDVWALMPWDGWLARLRRR